MTRYSRTELFAPIGPQGQARLRQSRVLIVGCGALGTHLAEFCTRAGVGALTIVDRDFVEPANLQRQGLFTEEDAAQALPKAEAARRALARVNGDVQLTAQVADFTWLNAQSLAEGATLILDGTDNFETRFLINDLAVARGIPWVYAACVGARAACMPVTPGEGACLTCLLEAPPAGGGETCDTAGVIMPAVLQAVAWASVVALKILTGNRDALLRKLYHVDLWSGERQVMDASRPRPDCPTCGARRFPWLEGRRVSRHTVLCGRDSVQVTPDGAFDFEQARRHLSRAAAVSTENEFLVRASAKGLMITLYRDGRALIHGTSDPVQARSAYAALCGM
jgi:molybdopterin/thiamine biosynthesis adenylyltransferase